MFASKSKFFAYCSVFFLLALNFYPLTEVQAKTINLGVTEDVVSIPGTLLNSKLAGTGNRCLYVDASGNVSVKGFDCGSATGGDNLGDHSATQNIRLGSYWLSGDAGNEGVYVNSAGGVGINTNSIDAGLSMKVSGNFTSTGVNTFDNVVYKGGGIRMITVDNSGVLGAAAIPVDTNTDVYWTGTATNLNAATGRTSLGLGSLATLSSVTSGYISNGTIVDADVSASAAIASSKISGLGSLATLNSVANAQITDVAWSKITGFPSACTPGQYVTAVGGTLTCSTPAGGVGGSGSANYISKWTAGSTLGNSSIYDNGNVGINNTSPGAKLQVNAVTSGEALRIISASDWSPLNIRNSTNSTDIFRVDQNGILQVGTVPAARITGTVSSANTANTATTATSLAANGANCSAGYYPLGVDASGAVETCTAVPTANDIYWTGTATNLNAATGRTSLGLGSLATLSSVTSGYISNGTIVDADVSASAAIASSKISGLGSLATLNSVANAQITDVAWSKITGFPSACTPGQYVTAVGGTLTCSTPPSGSDIYWTGTATNLNAATGRASLGLGSLATLSSVTSSYISNGTIVDADVSASAAIASSKIQYGTYFIDSAGNSGDVWTSDGSGAGRWSPAASGGLAGSGTNNYVSKWTGSSSQGNSIIYDNGSNVGIGTSAPGAKLDVNGSLMANSSVTFPLLAGGKLETRVVTVDGDGVLGSVATPASLPSGTASQTLRNNGLGGWSASSFLWNSGSTVGINYNLNACDSSIKLAVDGVIETTGIKVDSALPIGPYCSSSGNISFRGGVMEFTSSGGSAFSFDNLVNVAGKVNATSGFAVGLSSGISGTVIVKGSNGANCNLVFTGGILTSETCP